MHLPKGIGNKIRIVDDRTFFTFFENRRVKHIKQNNKQRGGTKKITYT